MSTPENSYKTNIQLFREYNEFSERFFRVVNLPNELQQKFLWLFSDTLPSSKYMGYFIWDNNLSDLVPYFGRDYFAENWTAIYDAFKIAGTYESYLLVIKSALGEDTIVTFEAPEPSHLIIRITEPTGKLTWNAYKAPDYNPLIPYDGGLNDRHFVFEKSVSDLTTNETAKLIELLNVNGVYVEANFGGQLPPTITQQPQPDTVALSNPFLFDIVAEE